MASPPNSRQRPRFRRRPQPQPRRPAGRRSEPDGGGFGWSRARIVAAVVLFAAAAPAVPLAVETGAAGRPETLLCWISTVIQLGGGSAVLLRPRAAAATGLAAAVGVLLLLWTGGLGVTAGYFGGINPWPPSRSSSPSD